MMRLNNASAAFEQRYVSHLKHPVTPSSSSTCLLVMNHEYAGDGLLHANGMATWNAAKVRKAQTAHGVSVIEL